MRSSAKIGSLLALLASFGCGGEDLGRPLPPAPATGTDVNGTNWCEAALDYEFLNIMDFEPGGTTTGLCDTTSSSSAASCNAYASRDDTHNCSGTTFLPSGSIFGGQALPGGRCDMAGNGMHVVGTRVAACIPKDQDPDDDVDMTDGKVGWGANIQVQSLPPGAPETGGGCTEPAEGVDPPGSLLFDASCWDGVSFWAKKSGPEGGSSITLTIADVWTSLGKKNPETGEDYCSTSATAVDTAKCDAPGAAVSLTEEWTFITVPFELMKQKGFGVPSPFIDLDPGDLSLDTGNLKGVTLLMATGDWDYWVDDVAFYRERN